MVIKRFPPVEHADEFGLLALGGDLEPESLRLAYENGIFPWPMDAEHLTWFAPPHRAVILFEHLHVPRSLLKAQRRSGFVHRIDTNFAAVIKACSEIKNRGRQRGTWITEEMLAAYCALHDLGWAHSVETYTHAGKLVGGVYGVCFGGMFAAESAFYREPYASRLALLHLIEHLKRFDFKWIDCQQLTPLSESFGAQVLPRSRFMQLLATALASPVFPFGKSAEYDV